MSTTRTCVHACERKTTANISFFLENTKAKVVMRAVDITFLMHIDVAFGHKALNEAKLQTRSVRPMTLALAHHRSWLTDCLWRV